MSQEECQQRLQQIARATIPWDASCLVPISNREFVTRMLMNLKGIYLQQKDYSRTLSILDHLVLIRPDSKQDLRDRGAVYFRLGRYQDALDDLQAYLSSTAPAKDTESVERLLEQAQQALIQER